MKIKTSCPREDTLGAYIEGGLTAGRKLAVERHLAGCGDCESGLEAIRASGEPGAGVLFENIPVRLMQNVLSLPAEQRSPFDIAVRCAADALKVLSCSSLMRMTAPVPAFGTLRAGRTPSPTVVVFSRILAGNEFEVWIEKIAEGTCNIQVVRKGNGQSECLLRAELLGEGRELMSAAFSREYVLFEDVGFGAYAIRIRKNAQSLGEITVKIA